MTDPALTDRIAFSNSVRLDGRQWLGIGVFALAIVLLASRLWSQVEDLPPESDYRIPHALSQDYWLYQRYADLAVKKHDTILIGDSVIWGEYAKRQETLSHYLNVQTGTERFANLGLDGAHPMALAGLVEHYAGDVANTNVVLQWNALWLSSLAADLRDEKRLGQFNHPKLVPQFWPHIPMYPCPWFPDDPKDKQKISQRLGYVVERNVGFLQWTGHVQQAYYDQNDIPGWTLKHPYANPLEPLTKPSPESDNKMRHLQQPWFKNQKTKEDMAWVELDESLQWPAFQRVVEVLQRRGNRVFVVVGPFNEHLLTPASLSRYHKIKGTVAAWLKEKHVPHLVPEALPTEQYGDASHPLPGGYEMLARQLLEHAEFRAAMAAR